MEREKKPKAKVSVKGGERIIYPVGATLCGKCQVADGAEAPRLTDAESNADSAIRTTLKQGTSLNGRNGKQSDGHIGNVKLFCNNSHKFDVTHDLGDNLPSSTKGRPKRNDLSAEIALARLAR